MFQSISSIDFVYFLSQADQVDSKFLWLKVIAFLCILGALGFFISRFNKNKIINSQIKGDGRIRIADSCSLGNRQYLVIAQCDKDRFLLGVGPNCFQNLAKLPQVVAQDEASKSDSRVSND